MFTEMPRGAGSAICSGRLTFNATFSNSNLIVTLG
jgi:hypothetical protein